MRIGICQVNSVWENRASTRERILGILEVWKGMADCLVFPEMVLSGFSMNADEASLDAADCQFFIELANRFQGAVFYGGVENGSNCVFRALSGGTNEVVYKKRHMFTLGDEGRYYSPGSKSVTIEIQDSRFSFAICYDLRFAYHFWSQARQCDGYIVIASWPESRQEHWTTLLRARAIENQAFVIGVNRVGKDPNNSFAGGSAVFGPFGELILECGNGEGIFCCDIDPSESIRIRAKYGFLEDRLE
jgi:omega-amidase